MTNPVRFSPLRRFWIAALCALVCAGCDRSPKNDPKGALDHFFTLIGKQSYQEAYDGGSLAFQTQMSEANFEAICRDLKMNEFNSVAWTLDSQTADEAHLTGEFTSKENKKLVLAATVIKDAGTWKLFSMRTPSPNDQYTMVDIFGRFNKGLGFNDAFTRQLPNDAESKLLVLQTMLKINESLHSKNFSSFFQDTAVMWQMQSTPEIVARSFKAFTDGNVTIDFVKDTQPIFDEPPRLDAQGHLLLKGYYPTHPNKLVFNLQYVFELPRWKLVGMSVNFK